MQLEAAVLESEQGDIAAGEHALAIALDAAWDWVKGLPQQVLDAAKWVAGVPRELIGSALGFPPWVVPVGLIAAAVYLVREWGRRPGTR
jgi:hypothetical protein